MPCLSSTSAAKKLPLRSPGAPFFGGVLLPKPMVMEMEQAAM